MVPALESLVFRDSVRGIPGADGGFRAGGPWRVVDYSYLVSRGGVRFMDLSHDLC
jgi:hypothetical protein